MEIILDAAFLGEKEQAHDYIKEMLDLPYYYGRNLDALYDCLQEMSDLKLVIKNTDGAGEYFGKVLRVFNDACCEVEVEGAGEQGSLGEITGECGFSDDFPGDGSITGVSDLDFDDSSDGDN